MKTVGAVRVLPWAALISLSILVIAGCGSGNPSDLVATHNKSNIQRLRNAYSLYATAVGTPPKEEKAFREFLRSDETAKVLLGRMGVAQEEVDEIFVSERDQQPFKIRWNIGGPKDHPIVFEAVGLNGKKMVAFYEPREIDESEIDRYWNGEYKPEF